MACSKLAKNQKLHNKAKQHLEPQRTRRTRRSNSAANELRRRDRSTLRTLDRRGLDNFERGWRWGLLRRHAQRTRILESGLHGSHNHAGFYVEKVDTGEGESHPGIDDDALVQYSIQDIEERRLLDFF